MSEKQKSPRADYAEAVESGDIDWLHSIYDNEKAAFGFIMGKQFITPHVWATVANAARQDPEKLQRQILHRILALQYTLLDRVEHSIRTEIAEFDGRGHYSDLPEQVQHEHLPRYGKIASEIYVTMKMLRKIGAKSESDDADQVSDAGT